MITAAFFRGVKRPGHDVDHLPPRNAKIKNEGSCRPTSTPPVRLWGVDRHNFKYIPLSNLLAESSTFIGIKYCGVIFALLYDWCFHPILVISLFNIRPRNRTSRRVFLVILASSSEQMATQHIKLEHD